MSLLCNRDLSENMWALVKTITQTKFNHQTITLKDLKYLGIRDHLEKIAQAFDELRMNPTS
jgi:hypothetical protein